MSVEQIRFPFSVSAGPVNPRRQRPPYFPISLRGLTTMSSADSGSRCSTGGSLPAFTSSASMGASANFLGNFVTSRMISGPSSFPMNWAPSLGSACPASDVVGARPVRAKAPEASAVSRRNSRRVTPPECFGMTNASFLRDVVRWCGKAVIRFPRV